MKVIIMAAHMAGHYILHLWFLAFFFFFSSPARLSGRRLDVYHISRVVFVGGMPGIFPVTGFPPSTPLTRNLPSQPGKATFPTTGVGQSKIRC